MAKQIEEDCKRPSPEILVQRIVRAVYLQNRFLLLFIKDLKIMKIVLSKVFLSYPRGYSDRCYNYRV
jgi:hypothetical protein